jgi:hypothetical protein
MNMELELMSFKDLLALYNSMSEKQAGPKTFASRARMIERIRKLAADKYIDLASFGRPQQPEAAVPSTQPQAEATESPEVVKTFGLIPEQTPAVRGLGVGALARQLLLDPAGTPHANIAAEVNRRIAGAHATDKSVRWYAHRMRKDGIEVPPRQKAVIDDGSAQIDNAAG